MTALTRFAFAMALAGATTLVAATAHAGGPLAKCSDGVPYLWPDGGRDIVWNPDQGNLGPLDKASADALVDDSFGQWEDIDSATISFVQGADLPLNVDETNFGPFLEPAAPDGLSAIVYDDTGEIFNLVFGPDSGVLGFAGPEWLDPSNCTILEGVSFLNGPAFDPLDNRIGFSIMVHEFGHFGNLAHSQTNGGILLGIALGEPQASGPDPFNTFGAPTVADFVNQGLIETMYPFLFGADFGVESPGRDDVTMMSRLYPEADHFATTASLTGSIFGPNGTTRLSGVNVIARNIANPFLDAVSALSGDFTDEEDPAVSDVVGTYRFTGLTPGAQYAVFVDQILQGGFSTPPRLLPGPEEFHSGAGESTSDPPDTFVAVSAAAGATTAGVNVIFNRPQPGQPLAVGDDGFVELFPPFPFDFCGRRFDSLFVNANGNVTFDASDASFLESAASLLIGPPRIAGLWDDMDPSSGGTVVFEQSSSSFTVRWTNVPEFGTTNTNSFAITLNRKDRLSEIVGPLVGSRFAISYGGVSARDGLVGYSCGGALTGGFEQESDLSRVSGRIGNPILPSGAIFEQFVGAEVFDLAGELRFNGVNRIADLFELGRGNDDVDHAVHLPLLPFNSAFIPFATMIDPIGNDVDFYTIDVDAGEIVAIEVVRGNFDFDSLLGVFDADTGELLAVDDDGGDGLLSRLLLQVETDTRLAFAVTAFPDLDFVGAGESGGRYTLFVNTYRGEPIALGDDDTLEVPLGPFAFRFQGAQRTSMFVNSNGSVSFGAGDPSLDATPAALLAGPPRISPLWTDLDPTGLLGNPGLVLVDTTSSSAAVHFVSVSEFFSSSPNYFSAELARNGRYNLRWGATARGSALVGATQGNGAADPGPTDLSDGRQSANGTTYEDFQFNATVSGMSNFDLFFGRVEFR